LLPLLFLLLLHEVLLLLLSRRCRCRPLLLLNDAASNNPTKNTKTDPETVTRVSRCEWCPRRKNKCESRGSQKALHVTNLTN
jgi:hypothetical protein